MSTPVPPAWRNARLPQRVVLQRLRRLAASDAAWRDGRTWSLVYHLNEHHADDLAEVYRLFFAENGLSPSAFPSLAAIERDVVSLVASLLHAPQSAAGTMTTGGTESILLAVRTYRERFREDHPRTRKPEIVLPSTAHPAFLKAADYFGLSPVIVRVTAGQRLNPRHMMEAVSPRTALLVASAPTYPDGMVDPIVELGALARRRRLGFHVDACLGGMFLPFLPDAPAFDFRVPGVTSISTDLHKFGYAPKGASVVLYRSRRLWRLQHFMSDDWNGGAYFSPTMLGTRSGGVMAATWAALMRIGYQGYATLARRTMRVRDRLIAGLQTVDGLQVLGAPDMSVLAFTSTRGDIFAIAEGLEARGWRIDRQRNPDAIHLIVTAHHVRAVTPFVRDILQVVRDLNAGHRPRQRRPLIVYGATGRPAFRRPAGPTG